MTTFRQVFLQILHAARARQASDGSMPAGHNGPYDDPETPVRNTSHYIIAFLRAWELSADEAFRRAAERCVSLLLDRCPYRQGYTFHHRTKEGKDSCNGLIGTAWNMEALLYAAEKLATPGARVLARDLFLMHPFDKDSGIWQRVEPDGRLLSYDPTFNHQLWFAACAASLTRDTPLAAERIGRFLEKIPENWALATNGRIIHPLWGPETRRRWREHLKRLVKRSYRHYIVLKEVGYHAFNLYAFARLQEEAISWPDRGKKRLDQAIGYLNMPEYSSLIGISPYGLPYNPPGWEVPYVSKVFSQCSEDTCRPWLERQLAHSYDESKQMLCRNVHDPETHTARIYEAARLPDSVFNLNLQISSYL